MVQDLPEGLKTAIWKTGLTQVRWRMNITETFGPAVIFFFNSPFITRSLYTKRIYSI